MAERPTPRRPTSPTELSSIIKTMVDNAMAPYLPFLADVVAESGGAYDILRPESDTADGVYYPSLQGGLAIGDTAYGMRTDDRGVILLGKVGGGVDAYTKAEVDALLADMLEVGDESLILHTSGDASTTPIDATNASTSSYLNLFSSTWTLPAGTWDGRVFVFGFFSNNTANGGATFRIEQPSLNGGLGISMPVANTTIVLSDNDTFSGATGSVTVAAEYTARTTGTATARGWSWFGIARRTA